MRRNSLVRWCLVVGVAMASCLATPAAKQTGKVGIFDLDALHRVPLDPEVVARKVDGTVVTEAVRVTSVPGVRVLTILTYPLGQKGKGGTIYARRYGAEARVAEAKAGFVSVSVAPPVGNEDPLRLDSVGGPKIDYQIGFRQFFQDDPNRSPLYHHVVALTRVIDYLATRPEIDLKKTAVIGTEWPGMAVALLHAIDDRPAAYFVWHGMGFYTDPNGMSGGMRSRVSRKAYEMYCPAAYAAFGTRPFYIGNGTNGDESRFDAVIELARNLKCPKVLAFAPNRERADSSMREFSGSGTWQGHFTNPVVPPPSIGDGEVTLQGNRIRYTCKAEGATAISLLVSYGDQREWTGRNWDRLPMKREGNQFVVDVPVYVPISPIYAFAQVQTATFGTLCNVPTKIDPDSLGLKEGNAEYPHELLGANDLYVATGKVAVGSPAEVTKGADAKGFLKISPSWDGMVRLKHIDPTFWKGAKTLTITVKGDGLPSILNVYLALDSRNEIDSDLQNYSKFVLLKPDEKLDATWRTFTIQLNQVTSLVSVDSLFIETGGKPLTISSISWR